VFPVPLGQPGDHRVLECSALTKRTPRLGGDAVLGVKGAQLRLLEAGVQFDLVHGRHDLALGDQPLQLEWGEVGDTDGPDPPVGIELLELPPGLTYRSRLGTGQ
jgi:hypothetical protein